MESSTRLKLKNNYVALKDDCFGEQLRNNKITFDGAKLDVALGHYYETYKAGMKEDMDHVHVTQRIDRHKIATICFCSLIKARPLISTPLPGAPATLSERTANEQAAFFFAVSVLESFNKTLAKDPRLAQIPVIDALQKDIELPTCWDLDNAGKSKYIDHVIKLLTPEMLASLDYDNVEKYDINQLYMWANVFFLIENGSLH